MFQLKLFLLIMLLNKKLLHW